VFVRAAVQVSVAGCVGMWDVVGMVYGAVAGAWGEWGCLG